MTVYMIAQTNCPRAVFSIVEGGDHAACPPLCTPLQCLLVCLGCCVAAGKHSQPLSMWDPTQNQARELCAGRVWQPVGEWLVLPLAAWSDITVTISFSLIFTENMT